MGFSNPEEDRFVTVENTPVLIIVTYTLSTTKTINS